MSILIFWAPNYISGTDETKVAKFGAQVGYVKCYH